jgi:6,7-dimethyl-8-ribityllumazine synthase
MSSSLKNLSVVEIPEVKNKTKLKIAIVAANWNNDVTYELRDGAFETLTHAGLIEKNIAMSYVPGTFELVLGAIYFCEQKFDAVICLGCVIQGDTPHFTFICDAVANGIMNLNIKYQIPVIFGVLTTNTLKQAQERSGGKHGNKGVEAAATALQMIALEQSLIK